MPRKSQALRIEQTQALIAAYQAAGINGTPLRFMVDMERAMARGKYPSKRQRDWLDKLIDEGVPKPVEPSDLYKKMSEARTVFLSEPDKSWEADVLGEFMHREAKGWSFSEKQTALMNRLVDGAAKIAAGENKLDVTDEMRDELVKACALYKGYSDMWQHERPAVARARQRVLNFLAGETYIEQYHYDKLTNAVKAKLTKLKNPRFSSGDMGYTSVWQTKEKKVWICASDVYVSETGNIVNDWIDPNGVMVTKDQDSISKR
jgi:hypothetical protein